MKPAPPVTSTRTGIPSAPGPARDVDHVAAVAGVAHALTEGEALLGRDEAHPQRDLLEAGDPHALSLLEGSHELAGVQQRLVRSGVQPGEAATQVDHACAAAIQIGVVHVGDLELPAGGRGEPAGDLDDVVVVEVEAGDGAV